MAWRNINVKGWESHNRVRCEQKGGIQRKDAPETLFRAHKTHCSLCSKTGPECGIQETAAHGFPGKSTPSHYTSAKIWRRYKSWIA